MGQLVSALFFGRTTLALAIVLAPHSLVHALDCMPGGRVRDARGMEFKCGPSGHWETTLKTMGVPTCTYVWGYESRIPRFVCQEKWNKVPMRLQPVRPWTALSPEE